MIALINGLLIDKATGQVIVEANGIGYLVHIPLSTYYELPETNNPVKLNIHTSVKQDAISLYGFSNVAERDIFQLLMMVTGIGPKLALNILSGISVADLVRAVTERDIRSLSKAPGVGKKTAERIVLELRDKFIELDWKQTNIATEKGPFPDDQLRNDAISALVNLGYKNQAAQVAVDKMLANSSDPPTMDVLLRQALKILTG